MSWETKNTEKMFKFQKKIRRSTKTEDLWNITENVKIPRQKEKTKNTKKSQKLVKITKTRRKTIKPIKIIKIP